MNRWIGDARRHWRLCYKKTVNGAASATFHSLCDFRGPSVTVLKTGAGVIFGGYINTSWALSYTYRASSDAFLFSITNHKRYPLGYYDGNAIYSHVTYGPTFGNGHDIYVNATMDLGYCKFPYAYSCNGVSVATPS